MFIIRWLIKIIIMILIGWGIRWYLVEQSGVKNLIPF